MIYKCKEKLGVFLALVSFYTAPKERMAADG